MMENVAIVEDEEEALERICNCLKRFSAENGVEFNVVVFNDAVGFLEKYTPNYDIVFMDIKLPDMNGMDASKKLRETDKSVALVFVTNMSQYAVKGYEVGALDFIVKPVAYSDFSLKLQRVLRQIADHRDTKLSVVNEDGVVCVLGDVSFMVVAEADGGGDVTPPGKTTHTYEAEDVDLYGLSGPVFSGEASDYKMIMGRNTKYITENYQKVLDSVSNGYFVSYFNGPGTILSFEFNADQASTGNTLKIRLASEWGTLNIKPTNIVVRVNGTQVDYEPFTVGGVKLSADGSLGQYRTPFKDYTLTTDFAVASGSNTIEVEVGEARDYGLDGFVKYGPGVDCLKIVTDASTELTWEKLFESRKDNIANN